MTGANRVSSYFYCFAAGVTGLQVGARMIPHRDRNRKDPWQPVVVSCGSFQGYELVAVR